MENPLRNHWLRHNTILRPWQWRQGQQKIRCSTTEIYTDMEEALVCSFQILSRRLYGQTIRTMRPKTFDKEYVNLEQTWVSILWSEEGAEILPGKDWGKNWPRYIQYNGAIYFVFIWKKEYFEQNVIRIKKRTHVIFYTIFAQYCSV